MGLFNRIQPDPGFVSPVRSDPGFVSLIPSDPIQVLLTAQKVFVSLTIFCI